MPKIRIDNVSYSAGKKQILNDINLECETESLYVLCGPSGAGKTMLMRILTGEVTPDKGDVLVDGRSVLDLPPQKRGIILVPQSNQLFPHMTVEENAEFPLKVRGINKQKRKEKIHTLAEQFGLIDLLDRYPAQISGGQQKLAAVMRSLAADPKVLILDEPFTGLDNVLHQKIREFIVNLQREQKITMILITHDKEDAFIMGSCIGFMFGGKIKLSAECRKILELAESDEEVRNFLGKTVMLQGGKWVFEDRILSKN